jgi:hypothetical protein
VEISPPSFFGSAASLCCVDADGQREATGDLTFAHEILARGLDWNFARDNTSG